jgi:hypothetical protein
VVGEIHPSSDLRPSAKGAPGTDSDYSFYDHSNPWRHLRPWIITPYLVRLGMLRVGQPMTVGDDPGDSFSPIAGEQRHHTDGDAKGVEIAFHRFGRVGAWNIHTLTQNSEIGWIEDHERYLRIHQDLYDKIKRAANGLTEPWGTANDGHVWIKGNRHDFYRDGILDRIAKRLIKAGYLTQGTALIRDVVMGEDGWYRPTFLAALNEIAREAGTTGVGQEGENTNAMLRVKPELLRYLESRLYRRELEQMRTQMKVKVVGPVMGGLPRVS